MENRHIAFSPPDITEEEITEVVDTLKSGWITTGPKTKKFEKKLAEYIGTSKVVCLNSATACAEMILRVLGIGEGDEVITTAYTYTATASVIAHVGAKIVMVDVNQDSYQMNMNQVEAAVTEQLSWLILAAESVIIQEHLRSQKRRNQCSIRNQRFRRRWDELQLWQMVLMQWVQYRMEKDVEQLQILQVFLFML